MQLSEQQMSNFYIGIDDEYGVFLLIYAVPPSEILYNMSYSKISDIKYI